jgi:ABC-2 type transport system ATP-binding protein
VTRLVKAFGRQRALAGIDLDVDRGEAVAVVGPHDSGKSTLLRILVDLQRPTSGHAWVEGVTARRGARTRRRVGYLPSPVQHEPYGTVRAMLHYAAALSRSSWIPFRDLSAAFGLSLGDRLARLSPGEVQKLGLVLALGHRPSVILLDEPAAALDPVATAVLIDVLEQRRTDGAAIVLAAHRLEPFDSFVDRVILLRQGEIVLAESAAAMRRAVPSIATIEFAGPPPLAELRTIDPSLGVSGRVVRLSVGNNPGRLLTALSGLDVTSIDVRARSLTDVLAVHYGDEDDADGRSVIGDGA